MDRIEIAPRPDWLSRIYRDGLYFHSADVPYWNEAACYVLSQDEALTLHAAAEAVHALCLEAVEYAIHNRLYDRFHIPSVAIRAIEYSWYNCHPSLYGRFDFAFGSGGPPKMLEYNADTPTGLLEAAFVQRRWRDELYPTVAQMNNLDEALVAQWRSLAPSLAPAPLHCLAIADMEDCLTVSYLALLARRAGLAASWGFIDDLYYDDGYLRLTDGLRAENLFKLYPWEWAWDLPVLEHLNLERDHIIEPAWKMLLSNKALLPLLWELFPGHPNLLEAYVDGPRSMTQYAMKPIYSREGANITIHTAHGVERSGGIYGVEGVIYQAYTDLGTYAGHHPVLGTWIIGDQCHGLGIRESRDLITNNRSRFTPHLVTPSGAMPL